MGYANGLADGLSRASELRALLREVYDVCGPKAYLHRAMMPYPIAVFATMTSGEVDSTFDFPDRHLMHRIAKALNE
jgi:hypothetical protein